MSVPSFGGLSDTTNEPASAILMVAEDMFIRERLRAEAAEHQVVLLRKQLSIDVWWKFAILVACVLFWLLGFWTGLYV